jgi:hypothetical protein
MLSPLEALSGIEPSRILLTGSCHNISQECHAVVKIQNDNLPILLFNVRAGEVSGSYPKYPVATISGGH